MTEPRAPQTPDPLAAVRVAHPRPAGTVAPGAGTEVVGG